MTPGNLCTCINEPDAVRGRAAGPRVLVHIDASEEHDHKNGDAVTEAKGQALVRGADNNAMLRTRFASIALIDLGPAAFGTIAVVRAALE